MLIHVVDDHEMMREVTVALLRRLNRTARIVDFATFEHFIQAVDDQGAPDLLVMDLVLPGIKNHEGVVHARDRCPHSKIAVCSAMPATDQQQACLESGADIYIEKSLGATAFASSLHKLMG